MSKVIFLLVFVFFLQGNGLRSQSLGDKSFYITDSLNLDEISMNDKLLIDSCLKVFHKSKIDTVKLSALAAIVEDCWDDNIWPKYNKIIYEKVNKHIYSSDKISKTELFFYKKLLGACLNNMAYSLDIQGETDSALFYYNKCLLVFNEIKDKIGLADTYNNMGYIYRYQGNVPKAIEYYQKSLKLNQELNNKKGIALVLNNLSLIYNRNNDLVQAEKLLLESMDLKIEINDVHGLGYTYINLADIYRLKKLKKQAIEFYLKAITTLDSLGEKNGVANCYNNLGLIYFNDNELDLADKFFQKSMDLNIQLNNINLIAISAVNMGNLNIKRKNYKQAEKYGLLALKYAKDGGYIEALRDAAALLYNVNKVNGNYKQALEMYELRSLMHDSMINDNNRKEAIRSQLQYSYEKQAVADSIKNAEEKRIIQAQILLQDTQLKQEKTKRIALYGGLILVIIFAGFMYNRFKVTNKQKLVIESQNKLVENQKQIIEDKHMEVLDSIRYAKRIQDALMTSQNYIERNIKRLKE
ncbi:MAG: tetratricopeptide repeat protein [Flavobacteriales bacterium]